MGWRRRHSRRQSPHYNEYLDAIRLMLPRRYLDEAPCNCAMCVAEYGFRRHLEPVMPPPYPGDKFFRDHPELRPLTNPRGEYMGYERSKPRWIDRPEMHFASCRGARCRSRKKRQAAAAEAIA